MSFDFLHAGNEDFDTQITAQLKSRFNTRVNFQVCGAFIFNKPIRRLRQINTITPKT